MNQTIFTIDNLYFIIAVALLTLWLTIVSSKGGLTDNRFQYWWRKLTKRGWIAILLGIFIAFILGLQEVNNRNISKNKDNELNKEQNSRDSLISTGINKGVDTSNQKLFKDLSVAFMKQGLQYDSIKKQIIVLKDSVGKSKDNIIPPLLRVKNLEFKNRNNSLHITTLLTEIISDDAASYNTHIRFDIYAFTPEGLVTAVDFDKTILYDGINIAKGQILTGSLSFIDNYNRSFYVLRLKGFFYSSIKVKIKIDELYLLRLEGNKAFFEIPVQFHDTAVREYIKENNF